MAPNRSKKIRTFQIEGFSTHCFFCHFDHREKSSGLKLCTFRSLLQNCRHLLNPPIPLLKRGVRGNINTMKGRCVILAPKKVKERRQNMITTTTLQKQDTTGSAVLYMALELSNTKWKVGFSNGEKIRQVTITARDLGELEDEIEKARERFCLEDDMQIVSCYEAGRSINLPKTSNVII